MSEFRRQWDFEMALEVLRSETVDSETWAEAVKWLILYGPPEMRDKLQQAAAHATGQCFPGLKTKGYTEDGQPCYDIKAMAEALGISEEEVIKKIAEMEKKEGIKQLFDPAETYKIQ